MYGEYDEMKRKIQQLSSELAVSAAGLELLPFPFRSCLVGHPCWGLTLRLQLHCLPN